MARTGPPSSAPDGYGILTREGYRRIWVVSEKRYRMEHAVVWERAYGPIPKGWEIHHKDHVPINNSLENLELLSRLCHKRLHSGFELRGDRWWKPCTRCAELKPIEKFPRSKAGALAGRCKACTSGQSVIDGRKRRELLRANHSQHGA